jgi:hypothetical protein
VDEDHRKPGLRQIGSSPQNWLAPMRIVGAHRQDMTCQD